jgi:hypothetical protein
MSADLLDISKKSISDDAVRYEPDAASNEASLLLADPENISNDWLAIFNESSDPDATYPESILDTVCPMSNPLRSSLDPEIWTDPVKDSWSTPGVIPA